MRLHIIAIISALLLSGCATTGAHEDLAGLKKQILELQKTQGVQSSQIEELNNKILLMRDRLDGDGIPENEGSLKPRDVSKAKEASKVKDPSKATTISKEKDISEGMMIHQGSPLTAPEKRKTSEAETREANEAQYPVTKMDQAQSPSKLLTLAEKIFAQASKDAQKTQLADLERDVSLLVKEHRNSPATSNGLFLYGDTLYERKQYQRAAEQFERLYKLFPDGNKAVAALYSLGLCYEKMGHPDEAKEAYQNVITIYPGSREARLAEKKLGSGVAEE